jgi:NTE family protein
MKAYAILAGGGVKGAALAGCIAAAESQGIEFVGFGGTSAGSIVALLASVGYSGEELRSLAVDEMDFLQFFDDKGVLLNRIKSSVGTLSRKLTGWQSLIGPIWKAIIVRELLRIFSKRLGLYDGQKLRSFLHDKIIAKKPELRDNSAITFDDLKRCNCKLLKIVATDIVRRQAVIFSGESGHSPVVVDAVLASASYPFVFQPVRNPNSIFVDGGLSSNLPVFLFEEERKRTRYPVLAFDLAPRPNPLHGDYDVSRLARDMLSTVLESSDQLLRQTIGSIVHIPVDTPDYIDTLDFDVDRKGREALYQKGFASAINYLREYVPLRLAGQAGGNLRRELQSIYGPPWFYETALAALAKEIERHTNAKKVRVSIMLDTGRQNDSRIVVYDYGMTNHTDVDLELAKDAGCSGQALMHDEGFVVADLDQPASWIGITTTQKNLVPRDRKSMISVVLRGWSKFSDLGTQQGGKLPRFGTLTIDSSTALTQTGWMDGDRARGDVVERIRNWSYIISRLLP